MLRASRRAMMSGLLLGALLAGGCGGAVNTPPRGTHGPRARVTDALPGQVVQLELQVVDDEGDPLTYRWTQAPAEPAGTFSDPTVPEPTWTAPEVTQATYFTLKLMVADDHDNTVVSSVSITVRPRTPAN